MTHFRRLGFAITLVSFTAGCVSIPQVPRYEAELKEPCHQGWRAGVMNSDGMSVAFSAMWRGFTFRSPKPAGVVTLPNPESMQAMNPPLRDAYLHCYTEGFRQTQQSMAGFGKFYGHFLFVAAATGAILGAIAGLGFAGHYSGR